MRPSTVSTSTKLLLVIAVVTLLAGVASASNISGAIFTTTSTGTKVNGNIYDSKADVYLNGGPQNTQDPGLVPDGTYYFQVTDPSGKVLLSLDDISCRQVVVTGGRITGVPGTPPPVATCVDGYHNPGTFDTANGEQPIQLCNPNTSKCGTDFADTPNPGGEYKAWLTLVSSYSPDTCTTGRDSFGFCDSASKTDNFKIKNPKLANITVCKFQACTITDDDGTCGGTTTDPLLSGWTIDATGADQSSQVTAGTGGATPFGCATFSVSKFTDGSATVGLTEVLQSGWTQTAPDSKTPGSSQCSPTGTIGSPAGETCTVKPGDNVAAENFGNLMGEAGVAPTVVKTANGGYNTTYSWTVAKSVDQTKVYTAGGGSATVNYTVTVTHDGGTISNVQVTGDITVNNPNPFPITLDSVTDQLSDGTACSVDVTAGLTIPASTSTVTGSSDFPYICTLSAVPTGEEDNTVLITWLDQNGTLNDVPWTLKGNSLPYTFSNISFTNGVIDGSVTVTDTLDGVTTTLGTVASTDTSPMYFNFPETFSDLAGTCTTHTNTASIKTSTGNVTTTTDAVKVTDCQGADLTVSKTATPAFTRSYNWSINKSVDKTTVESSASTVKFNYTVVVSETGFNDSGWQVTGTITVSNPNDWEAVTVNVTDAINNGGVCVVTGGTSQPVPASGSISPTYTCTYAAAPSPAAFTNTATATWDKTVASTPDGSKSGIATGAFGSPTNPVNQTITPQDNFNAGGNVNLCTLDTTGPCTLTAVDVKPYTTHTYKYSRTVNDASTGLCVTYTNTAVIKETGQTSSQTVTVCNTGTGALTMGFWKNTNGQKIISKSCMPIGGTSLMTFLTQFNPFKDDTKTSCNDEATYVSGVISGATCSTGGTCNTMLRAQMLATALDVYFSTSVAHGGGGNQIGAYNGLSSKTPELGGVAIDLSHMCSMADGSSGSTCSGKYEDARPEFGILAPCLGTTVLNMLLYSDFNSILNGSPVATANTGATWYKQIKTPNQVYAKDGFDNTNNQIANIAPTSCNSTF